MKARHFVRCLWAVALLAGALLIGVNTASATIGGASVRAASLVPAPSCPSGDTCVSIPGTAADDVGGGLVEAGPTHDLGPNQWVYLDGYGFTPGTILRIQYCTDTRPLPSPPLCLSSASVNIAQGVYITQALTTGTFELSFQIEQAATSDARLTGTVPGATSRESGTFLCDTTTPCSIDVTNVGNGDAPFAPTPQNTAVIPVSFAPASNGCGSSAQTVTTESEFGMELVLPVAARDSCASPNPVIAFNVALDGYGALQALEIGNAEVAFTDDPESSDQQDILKQGNYKLIPVALTANVVAFRAEQVEGQNFYPLFNLDLTPTMAAGLLTGTYENTSVADTVKCPNGSCPVPPCPQRLKTTHKPPICSLLIQANFSPGFVEPNLYGDFLRSDTAGSTGLFFSWVCNAPKLPVHVSIPTKTSTFTATYTDVSTSSQELEYGLGSKDKPVTKCPTTEQYPPLPVDAHGSYVAYDDPNQQDLKMVTFVPLSGHTPHAAFGTMNWAEAHYYGLAVAALQNAAGQFVSPSQASLDAAVAGATVNPDDTLTPDYTKAETGAYPMTSVEYAAVCADPTSTKKATATRDMLDQLLNVTGGPDSEGLPEGFVPLPTTLVQGAYTDISNDIVGGGSTTTSTTVASICPVSASSAKATTTSSSSSTASSGGALTSRVPSSAPPQTGLHFVGRPPGAGTGVSAPSSGHGRPAARTPVLRMSLASNGSRMLLPLAALLTLVALFLGGLLVLSASLRRHVAAAVRGVRKAAWSLASLSHGMGTLGRRRRRTTSRPW